MDENREKKKEDTTKYGEFVPSYFEWMTLEEQKKRAEELNQMTYGGKKCLLGKKL